MNAIWYRLLCVLIAALTFAGAAAEPARADLLQCFKALAPADKAFEASEIAARGSACAVQATSDPVMALTIAAISAAAVGGAFSGSTECKAAVNGAVGILIAEALLATPLTSELFTAQQKEWLNAFIQGNKAVSFTEILDQLGPLGDLINNYINCGCGIAGAPADLAELVEKYKQDVEGCANFAEDAIGTIGNAAGNFFEGIHEGLHGKPKVPGIQMETDCPRYILPVGYWTHKIWTNKEYNDRNSSICGRTLCPDGTFILQKKNDKGETGDICTRNCPDQEKDFTPGNQCYAISSYVASEGRCNPQGEQSCCQPGQAVFDASLSCRPACKQGEEYYDKKEKQCAACPANMHPIYEASNSSLGACLQCPFGHSYNKSSFKCECPPGQVTQTVSGEIRKGMFVNLTYCVPASPCQGNAVRDTTGKCIPCGKGLAAYNGRCVLMLDLHNFTTGKTKAIPLPAVPASCPSGQIRIGAACAWPKCPAGQIRQKAKCVWPPCPRGQIRKGASCLWPPCPAGQVRQKAKCVWLPCPPGLVRRGAGCVPLVKQPLPPLWIPPAKKAPPPGIKALPPALKALPPAKKAPPPQLKITPGLIFCPPGTQPFQGKCVPSIR